MNGRFLKIKKTTLLKLSFIINIILFIFSNIVFNIFYYIPNIWFYSFCFFIGNYLLIKSILFKLDSACYFGILLFLLGTFYLLVFFNNTLVFYPIYICLAFLCASFFTFYFYKQSFQFFLAISLFFVMMGALLYMLNLISLLFFLAILCVIVLLLLVRYLTLK